MIFLAGYSVKSQEVIFSLTNPTLNGTIFSFDVIANVPTGQTWNVGPTCLRIGYSTIPSGAATVHEDNPAVNANSNISNNASYTNMTTTIIMNDTGISLNALLLYQGTPYPFSAGTYTLGSIRFDVTNADACILTSIEPYSAVFDNTTPLTYPAQWSKTTDLPCQPIGIDLHQINHLPTAYKLFQNYPNPFNPATKIKFALPKTSNVKVEIFDELGRLVETLVSGNLSAGTYETVWNAGNYSSGLYFYRLTAGEYVQTLKMVVLK